MDYLHPIEAVIPGAQGRLLGVLARTEGQLTMRGAARIAGVSPNQAVSVLNHLVSLGLVERRDAGRARLVALARDNEAARCLLGLASLRELVLGRLRVEARVIDPAPASLVVFGSFASGMARVGSDLDVLAVRPAGTGPDDPRWIDSLSRWTDRAAVIAGNPVNLIEAGVNELPRLLREPGSVWRSAGQDGIVLVGSGLSDVGSAA